MTVYDSGFRMLMDTWENRKTISGDDKHKEKEHVGIAVTFIKIGQDKLLSMIDPNDKSE